MSVYCRVGIIIYITFYDYFPTTSLKTNVSLPAVHSRCYYATFAMPQYQHNTTSTIA